MRSSYRIAGADRGGVVGVEVGSGDAEVVEHDGGDTGGADGEGGQVVGELAGESVEDPEYSPVEVVGVTLGPLIGEGLDLWAHERRAHLYRHRGVGHAVPEQLVQQGHQLGA